VQQVHRAAFAASTVVEEVGAADGAVVAPARQNQTCIEEDADARVQQSGVAPSRKTSGE
jgi:hypothetical protein